MLSRLLFLLLLALNVGAAAWLLLGHAPAAPMPPATDPGVPELRLLSEKPPAKAATGSLPASASTSTQLVRDVCHTLGPFTTAAGMRSAVQTLSLHVARIQYRQENVRRSQGFWVFLPATTNREAALDEARQLVAKGIHDYYVVTAGDLQNTISLGLFNDQANAQSRLGKLQQLGFQAKVEQRFDTEPAYWVDYAVVLGSSFSWAAWLPGRNDLKAKLINCF